MHGGSGSGRGSGRRRLGVGVAVAVLGWGVTGCAGGTSTVAPPKSSATTATISGPSTSRSASPSLTVEQQAAEDAKNAYAAYRQTLDAVFQRGGRNARPDLSKVAIGEQLTYLVSEAGNSHRNTCAPSGQQDCERLGVRDVSLIQGKAPLVVLEACTDASKNDAIDDSGRSVRKPGALNHFIEVVSLVKSRSSGWLVSQEDDTPVKSC